MLSSPKQKPSNKKNPKPNNSNLRNSNTLSNEPILKKSPSTLVLTKYYQNLGNNFITSLKNIDKLGGGIPQMNKK